MNTHAADGPADTQATSVIPLLRRGGESNRVFDGRYELFDDVACSDMARIYRAWDHRLQHVVAIKVLGARYAVEYEVGRTFEEEAASALNLPDHPAISSVSGVGRVDGVPYLVRQYVAGKNIKDLIAEAGPLPVERALNLCMQAARALEFAHQYGRVHGDIKPQNILVDSKDRVYLTDFGMAGVRRTWQEIHGASHPVGDPYRAPEGVNVGASVAGDIYSLGAMLLEMLTGGASTGTTVSGDDFRVAVNGKLPDQVAAIVARTLQREPRNRYRSAGAFASALHEQLVHAKGDTTRTLSIPTEIQRRASQVAPPMRSGAHLTATSKPPDGQRYRSQARPVPDRRASRNLTFGSLLILMTVGIGAAGGWFAYKALANAINPQKSTPKIVAKPVHHVVPHHNRPAVTPHKTAVGAIALVGAGCPGHTTGPVELVNIWAQSVAPAPSVPVSFDYTIKNDAAVCHEVALRLSAVSTTQPATQLTDAKDDIVIAAQPGVHKYSRTFVFPSTAAGQRFDMVWIVTDPTKQTQYGQYRAPNLIGVGR